MRIPFHPPATPANNAERDAITLWIWRICRALFWGLALAPVVAGLLTFVVIQIGEDARNNVCGTVEEALIDFNNGLIDRFIAVSAPVDPDDTDAVDRRDKIVKVLRDDGRNDIVEQMARCNQ